MDSKIYDVIRKMSTTLSVDQLNELKNALFTTFYGCTIVEERANTDVVAIDISWQYDLKDFLTAKMLEGKTKETLERYRYELVRILGYINKSTEDITCDDISNYMQNYKRLKHVSNTTLQGMRSCYSSFFTWCSDMDRITQNPMNKVEKIKVPKTVKKPFSDEDREKLFRAATNVRDKAILEVLYSTAVRVSELCNIDISDINWEEKEIIVYGKGDKERIVYLNDKSCMYLKEYLESRTDDNPALFVGQKNPHNRLNKYGVEGIMSDIGKSANVDKCHPHRMRRTAITNAMNRGMPLQEAALMAGHASSETTLLYWSADKDSIKQHHRKYLSA